MRILRLAVFVLAFRPAFTFAFCGPWRSTYVSFRASNGEFVAAEGGGGRDLVANRGAVGNWEKFELATVDGTPFAIGKRLSLRGWGGQFVVAEPGAVLRDNRNAVGDWETFSLEGVWRRYDGDCSWMNVHLKTLGGKYVSAVNGGGGSLVASATTAGPSETFVMRAQPGKLDLDTDVLDMSETPGSGNTRWSRIGVDLCNDISFTDDSSGVVFEANCSRSANGGKFEVEVFRDLELKNGWHLIEFVVNRGASEVFDGIEVLERPAENPVGDIRPHVKYKATCEARSSCGFSVVNAVQGPRADPMF